MSTTNYDIAASHDHQERIHEELRAAGISRFGLHKFTSHYIPYVIGNKEHIKAVVFGRQREVEGFFGAVGGALVATDTRIVYIDHRPGYTAMDEISYGVVTGINVTQAGPYASLTLYTKIGDYHLSFAKPYCTMRFARYIEMRRVREVERSNLQSSNTM